MDDNIVKKHTRNPTGLTGQFQGLGNRIKKIMQSEPIQQALGITSKVQAKEPKSNVTAKTKNQQQNVKPKLSTSTKVLPSKKRAIEKSENPETAPLKVREEAQPEKMEYEDTPVAKRSRTEYGPAASTSRKPPPQSSIATPLKMEYHQTRQIFRENSTGNHSNTELINEPAQVGLYTLALECNMNFGGSRWCM